MPRLVEKSVARQLYAPDPAARNEQVRLDVAHRSRSRVRSLRDDHAGLYYFRELWRRMAALGWVGMCLPDAYEGLGLGFASLYSIH